MALLGNYCEAMDIS